MNRFQKYNFILILSLFSLPAVAEFSQKEAVQATINEASRVSPEIVENRHKWVEIKALKDVSASLPGVQVGVGYRWRLFGVDVRGSYAKTKYFAIRSKLDADQYYGGTYAPGNVGLEERRPRGEDDSWSYYSFEPGISIENKFFPELFPLFTERARVGILIGKFSDDTNDLTFNAYLFTIEAGVIRQLNVNSPWSIAGGMFWKIGQLMNADQTLLSSDRSLPIAWIGASLGLQYSF